MIYTFPLIIFLYNFVLVHICPSRPHFQTFIPLHYQGRVILFISVSNSPISHHTTCPVPPFSDAFLLYPWKLLLLQTNFHFRSAIILVNSLWRLNLLHAFCSRKYNHNPRPSPWHKSAAPKILLTISALPRSKLLYWLNRSINSVEMHSFISSSSIKVPISLVYSSVHYFVSIFH